MSTKEPITLCGLRQKFCTLTYGQSPCTAALGSTGDRKCFNTRKTCQDPANYDEGTNTIWFCEDSADVPFDWLAIPSLRRVTGKPTRLNVAGLTATSGPFGLRGTLSVELEDHPDGDRYTDKYFAERGYDPATRGTFWGKFLARNDDFEGSLIEVRTALPGQVWGEHVTREYFLESIDGPGDDGRVRLTGRDILSRADNDKVQAPPRTPGSLVYALNDSATEMWVSLETGPYNQYLPQGGLGHIVRIGDELIRFSTISVGDAPENRRFWGMTRGVYGTTPAAHEAGSHVQACLEFVNETPVDIIAFLLSFADIPSGWIPMAEWEDEETRWLLPYQLSAVIAEPTGIMDLLGEIAESCMLYIWTDERAKKIRLRAVRPAEDVPRPVTDEGHILAGTVRRSIEMKEHVTRCDVYYDMRDKLGDVKDTKNYNQVRVRLGQQPDNPRVRAIYSRWLTTAGMASLTARTLIEHANSLPVYYECTVGAKDLDIWTGDIVDLHTRTLQDPTGGQPAITPYLVIEANETPGEQMRLTLRAFGDFGLVSLIMGAAAPDYDSATPTQRESGCWIADADGNINGMPSPYLIG